MIGLRHSTSLGFVLCLCLPSTTVTGRTEDRQSGRETVTLQSSGLVGNNTRRQEDRIHTGGVDEDTRTNEW